MKWIVFFFKFIIYFEREREPAGEGQREKGRERESQAGSALSAQSLVRGSNSQKRELMTWAELKSDGFTDGASQVQSEKFKRNLVADSKNEDCGKARIDTHFETIS